MSQDLEIDKFLEIAIKLEKGLDKIRDPNSRNSCDEIYSFLKTYDHAVSKLYKLRSSTKDQAKTKYCQEVILETTHHLLDFKISEPSKNSYEEWLLNYRRIWLENLDLFFFTFCLFFVSMIVGWNIGVSEPSYVPLIIPQHMMEMIIDHNSWFARLQANPFQGGLEIAINNIKVSTICFLLGTLCGIGGITILCLNGILFGTMFGFCLTKGFHNNLFDFVLAHGFLELMIIIASCFAGLLIGRVFYIRPYQNFQTRISNGAKDAGVIATGVIPWLVLAATIEGFVSPFHYLDTHLKALVGILACMLFILWTFDPSRLLLSNTKA